MTGPARGKWTLMWQNAPSCHSPANHQYKCTPWITNQFPEPSSMTTLVSPCQPTYHGRTNATRLLSWLYKGDTGAGEMHPTRCWYQRAQNSIRDARSMEYETCAWSSHAKERCPTSGDGSVSCCQICVWRLQEDIECNPDDEPCKLNWDTLATRRLCRDATMVYKLVHQKVGIPLPDFIVRGDLHTRGSTFKFRIIITKCVLYQYLSPSTPDAYPCGTCCQSQLWRPPLSRTSRRWPTHWSVGCKVEAYHGF